MFLNSLCISKLLIIFESHLVQLVFNVFDQYSAQLIELYGSGESRIYPKNEASNVHAYNAKARDSSGLFYNVDTMLPFLTTVRPFASVYLSALFFICLSILAK